MPFSSGRQRLLIGCNECQSWNRVQHWPKDNWICEPLLRWNEFKPFFPNPLYSCWLNEWYFVLGNKHDLALIRVLTYSGPTSSDSRGAQDLDSHTAKIYFWSSGVAENKLNNIYVPVKEHIAESNIHTTMRVMCCVRQTPWGRGRRRRRWRAPW